MTPNVGYFLLFLANQARKTILKQNKYFRNLVTFLQIFFQFDLHMDQLIREYLCTVLQYVSKEKLFV